jgi:hypothetical protein
MARAWAEVVGRPHTFFRYNVAPGDQGPGITFLAAVVLLEEAIRLALVPAAYPDFGGRPLLSAVVWLLVAAVLVAPLGTHLVAALQTLLLAVAAPNRAGVSETVQVLCYASAPCLLAGVPEPWLRAFVVGYGAFVYVVGLAVVHDLGPVRATLLGILPAGLVFGLGFRGLDALATVAGVVVDQIHALLG